MMMGCAKKLIQTEDQFMDFTNCIMTDFTAAAADPEVGYVSVYAGPTYLYIVTSIFLISILDVPQCCWVIYIHSQLCQ